MQYPTVLVVDDDEDDRLLIQLGFKKANYPSLRLFPDANSILQYLQENSDTLPKLIISDYNMPCMSGLDLLKSIKTDDKLKHIDVIILSTSSSKTDIKECIDCGAANYYVKPSTEQGIIDLAKEILSKVISLGKEQFA